MGRVKEELIELAAKLPDNSTWEDVMYQIYVREKVEASLVEADAGELIPHDDVFKELEE